MISGGLNIFELFVKFGIDFMLALRNLSDHIWIFHLMEKIVFVGPMMVINKWNDASFPKTIETLAV